MSLIIHAPNIFQGGGRSLLLALLRALPSEQSCIAILDTRLDDDNFSPEVQRLRVRPSFSGRLAAEIVLRRSAKRGDTVLCFSNLPPLFKLQAKVYLYLQNRYLFSNTNLNGFPWKSKCRIYAQRLWLRSKLGNVDVIVVQTVTMQRDVLKAFNTPAIIKSFLDPAFLACGSSPERIRGATTRLLYVASGEVHKNHATLIEAWRLLEAEHCGAELLLTLDPGEFEDLVYHARFKPPLAALKVRNLGILTPRELRSLYQSVDALIYPSTMESFGLPLLEARQAGLPVIASERDFVRDVVEPAQSFDPESPVSIARAVKRFLGGKEEHQDIDNPQSFIRWLTS